MEDTLISFKVAKLAKEKGFYLEKHILHFYTKPNSKMFGIDEHGRSYPIKNISKKLYSIGDHATLNIENVLFAPTQSLLQKFIRETRGVHIEIHRNASGYYWSMCKADGGTDLGWSDISGPNAGGVWDSFEGALENALQVQLSYDLPNDITIIKHWGNYVEFALKSK